MWNRNCLPFRDTWVHPRFFMMLVLLNRLFSSVLCFVDHCLSFCFFLLSIVSSVSASGWPFGILQFIFNSKKKPAILLLQTSLNHVLILRYENYQFATNMSQYCTTLEWYKHYIKIWKLSICYKQLSVLCKH